MYPDKCFLCKKYRNHKNGVKFFTYGFPRKCKETYQKWLQICQISEADEIKNNPKVCFNCFSIDDFLPLALDSKKPKLKIGIVPNVLTSKNKRKSIEVSMI